MKDKKVKRLFFLCMLVICVVFVILSFLFPEEGEKSISINQSIENKFDSPEIKTNDSIEIDFSNIKVNEVVTGLDLLFNVYGSKMNKGVIEFQLINIEDDTIIAFGEVDCRRIEDNSKIRFDFKNKVYDLSKTKLCFSIKNIEENVNIALVCVSTGKEEVQWSFFNNKKLDGNFYCDLVVEANSYPYTLDLLLVTFIIALIFILKLDAREDIYETKNTI